MMDFHSLSRRELQALCKKNKIRANMKNQEMADALSALSNVEGIEDDTGKSQPETHPIACRKNPCRKPTKPQVDQTENEPEGSLPQSQSRRSPRRLIKEEEEEESKESKGAGKNVPLTKIPKTPATTGIEDDTGKSQLETYPIACRKTPSRKPTKPQVDQTENEPESSLPQSRIRRSPRRLIQGEDKEESKKSTGASENVPLTEIPKTPATTRTVRERVTCTLVSRETDTQTKENEISAVPRAYSLRRCTRLQQSEPKTSESVPKSVGRKRRSEAVNKIDMLSEDEPESSLPQSQIRRSPRRLIQGEDEEESKKSTGASENVPLTEIPKTPATIRTVRERVTGTLVSRETDTQTTENEILAVPRAFSLRRCTRLQQSETKTSESVPKRVGRKRRREAVIKIDMLSDEEETANLEKESNSEVIDDDVPKNEGGATVKVLSLNEEDNVVSEDVASEKTVFPEVCTVEHSIVDRDVKSEEFSANLMSVEVSSSTDIAHHVLYATPLMVVGRAPILEDDDQCMKDIEDQAIENNEEAIDVKSEEFSANLMSAEVSSSTDIARHVLYATPLMVVGRAPILEDDDQCMKDTEDRAFESNEEEVKKKLIVLDVESYSFEDKTQNLEDSNGGECLMNLLQPSDQNQINEITEEDEQDQQEQESVIKTVVDDDAEKLQMASNATTCESEAVVEFVDLTAAIPDVDDDEVPRLLDSEVVSDSVVSDAVEKISSYSSSATADIALIQIPNTTVRTPAKSSASSENNQIQVTPPPVRSSTKKKALTTTTTIIKVLEDNVKEENEIDDKVSLRWSNSKKALTVVVAEDEKENSKGENTHAQEESLRKESLRQLKKMMKRTPTNSTPVIIKVLEDKKMEEDNSIDDKVSLRRSNSKRALTVAVAEEEKENNTRAQEESLGKESLRRLKKMMKRTPTNSTPVIIKVLEDNEIDENVSLRSNSKVLTEVVVSEEEKENNKKGSTRGENTTTTAQEWSLRKKSLRQLKKMIKQRVDDRKKILITSENNNKNTVVVKVNSKF